MDHLVKKMRGEVYLDEGVVAQILVHLPAKPVIQASSGWESPRAHPSSQRTGAVAREQYLVCNPAVEPPPAAETGPERPSQATQVRLLLPRALRRVPALVPHLLHVHGLATGAVLLHLVDRRRQAAAAERASDAH